MIYKLFFHCSLNKRYQSSQRSVQVVQTPVFISTYTVYIYYLNQELSDQRMSEQDQAVLVFSTGQFTTLNSVGTKKVLRFDTPLCSELPYTVKCLVLNVCFILYPSTVQRNNTKIMLLMAYNKCYCC